MEKCKIMIFLFVLLVLPSVASAAEINDPQISPQVLWLDSQESVDINFICSMCSYAEVYITGPGTSLVDDAQKKLGTTNVYEYTYSPHKPGLYSVFLKGYDINSTNTTNATITFDAYKLKADIISPSASHPLLKYRGDGNFENVFLDFFLIGEIEKKITENDKRFVNFEMYLDDIKIDLQYNDDRYDTDSGHWVFAPKVPDEIPPGIYDLTINAGYENQEITVSHADSVIIKPSLEAEIIEPTKNNFISLGGTDKVTIKVRVTYLGQPILLKEPDFRFYLGDELIPVEVISTDPNDKTIWFLQLIVPGHDAGTKDITLYVEYEGETPYPSSLTEDDAIHFVIPFEGRIMDSSGTVRHMKVEFESSGDSSNYYLIENGNDGRYRANIIPGKYLMKMELPGINTIIHDVEITEQNLKETSLEEGPVNYDAPTKLKTIDGGIDVVKTAVLEFDLPFTEAEITIPYDDSKIKNEEMLEVYRCDNWNFGKASCAEEWIRIYNANVNPKGNVVMFNTSSPSAFVIGERKKLKLKLDSALGYDEYYVGESVIVKGVVTEESTDEAIENADVEIRISGIEDSVTTAKTIISGNFKGKIDLPPEKDLYNITITATKFPYIDASSSFTIEADIKEEISFVNVPDGKKLYIGDPLTVKFAVLNSGQIDLEDIRLYISGLDMEWYQLLPVSINDLDAGMEKEIELNVLVPKDYCESHECNNYYPVTIKAESGDIESEAITTFTLRDENPAEKEETKTVVEEEQEENTGLGLEGLITGGMAGTDSPVESMAIIGGILVIVILAVLSVKKKMTSPSGGPRYGTVRKPLLGGGAKNRNLLHYMKSGIKNQQNPHKNTSNTGPGRQGMNPGGGLLDRNKDNQRRNY